MFKRKQKSSKAVAKDGPALDVALIGCGPAGMMFLHALNKSKEAGGSNLPNVTCYERAGSAGGIWRDVPDDDKERKKPENVPVMYDDLWTSTPKELMEFHDYTFNDHFKKDTPSFLPRKDILEYLITRNSVDGALDDVKFNHTVRGVVYDEESKKFSVTVRDDSTSEESTDEFDKVIYAGGIHNGAEKPAELVELLREYTGKVLHSLECAEDFEQHVKDKRIMLIGDSGSGEDLALRAIKLGAEHVYIAARQGEGEASETVSWPSEKVTVVYGPPYKVVKGTTFKCHAVYWSDKKQKFKRDDDEEPVKVKDIDTVVMCTGYDYTCVECLHDDLQLDDEETWSVTKGWKMENNALTITLGSVKPSKELTTGSTCYPEIYRGVLIDNPSMFYITETYDTASTFLDLDVNANLVLAYLTGKIEIPKEKDMIKANQKQLEAEMQVPWLRTPMDGAYREEIAEIPDNHWSENADDERAVALDRMAASVLVKKLARDMKDVKYPLDLGDWKKLNALGEKLIDINIAAVKCRKCIPKEDSEWKTFRDMEQKEFVSLYTENSSCALPGRWMDLDTSTFK
uniref:FAD/NAD(P)-binding domain-containing protein n=1 Tax=Helicotheca tamesis TaxID=374047 RepID=A0A7S2MBP6_9STRA|mmetsp:Transcript_13047/g.17969  ORF Transcript_13047/g.17969 Transcript_13047/m.17969 type:complete len:571 (+) Transcript_13047:36-1748(+)